MVTFGVASARNKAIGKKKFKKKSRSYIARAGPDIPHCYLSGLGEQNGDTGLSNTMGSNCHGPQRSAAPHASSIYSEWVALHSHLRSGQPVVVSGQDLSIADVVAVSL